jgi:uncharacterized protein YjbI with pentapeptide repeats
LESADLNTTFEEKDSTGANLRDTNLGNAHLSWAILPGADRRGAFLPGAKFEGAVLDDIDLAASSAHADRARPRRPGATAARTSMPSCR